MVDYASDRNKINKCLTLFDLHGSNKKKNIFKKNTNPRGTTYSQNVFVSHFLILNNSKSQAQLYIPRSKSVYSPPGKTYIYRGKCTKKEKRIFRCMPCYPDFRCTLYRFYSKMLCRTKYWSV